MSGDDVEHYLEPIGGVFLPLTITLSTGERLLVGDEDLNIEQDQIMAYAGNILILFRESTERLINIEHVVSLETMTDLPDLHEAAAEG